MFNIQGSAISVPEAYHQTVIPGVYTIKLNAPLAVQYEVTAGCNHACRFCYNVWREKPTSAPQAVSRSEKEQIIRRIVAWEVFDVIFSGGEPLLDRDLAELINIASAAGLEASLITNGGLLTSRKCAELKQSGLSGIQVSLHASTPEQQDAITGTSGSYRRTIAGIRNVVAAFGGDSVNVNMVLTSDNYPDVFATAKLVKELGASQFSIGSLSETGSAALNEQVLTRTQFQNAYRELLRIRAELNLAVGISGGFPLCILLEIDDDPLELVSNYCDAGLNQVVIAPNGDMRACVCFPQVIGNILRDDPRVAWDQAEFLTRLRNLEHVPPACYNCRYVALCKGGCRAAGYAVKGDLQDLDPLGERR